MPDLGRPPGLRAGFHATVDDPVSGLLHAGEQWAPAHFLIERHTHPVWELYLQMHGVTRWVAAEQVHVLYPGHLLAVAPGVPHRLAAPTMSSHHFYFAAVDPAPAVRRHPALAARWRGLPNAVHRTGADALAGPFAHLIHELTVRQDFPDDGLTLAVDRIVLVTTRLLASTAAVPRLATHPAVRVVKDVLDREYDRRWTLPALAERVGLAPTYLAGLFAAEVGQPPHRYLTERRIERAKQLLTTSDLTITAIAIDLGFGSSQHFARAFRQVAGHSPTGYRRDSKSV